MINAKLKLILNDDNNKDQVVEYKHYSAIKVHLLSRPPGDSELRLIESADPNEIGKGLSLLGASTVIVTLSDIPREIDDQYLFDTEIKSKVNGAIAKGVKVYSNLEVYDGYNIAIYSGRCIEGVARQLCIITSNHLTGATIREYAPVVGRHVTKIIIEPCGCVQKYTDQDLRCQTPTILVLDQFGCPFELISPSPIPPPTS